MVRLLRLDATSLVNICDEELLGATVKDKQVEMNISKDYFGGHLVKLEEALELVRSSGAANLVGERIVSKVVEAGLASKLAVKKVGKVLFLMIFKFMG